MFHRDKIQEMLCNFNYLIKLRKYFTKDEFLVWHTIFSLNTMNHDIFSRTDLFNLCGFRSKVKYKPTKQELFKLGKVICNLIIKDAITIIKFSEDYETFIFITAEPPPLDKKQVNIQINELTHEEIAQRAIMRQLIVQSKDPDKAEIRIGD